MRRSLLRVYVHLVWATYQREPRLDERRMPIVHESLWHRCSILDATPLALGGVEDHIHFLVGLPATRSLARLVGELKASSAYTVNRSVPTGEIFRWQNTYAAFSVDASRLDIVRRYIAHQREHHRRKTPGGWELDE